MSPRAAYVIALMIKGAVLVAWLLLSHHLLGSWTSPLTYIAGVVVSAMAQLGINSAFCCPGCGASLAYWYSGEWRFMMPWPAAKCGKCGEPLDQP